MQHVFVSCFKYLYLYPDLDFVLKAALVQIKCGTWTTGLLFIVLLSLSF